MDHTIQLSILSEKIHDNRFLRLIDNLLDAGYLEQWRYHATLSGVPQGSVVSPVLSNIYLDRLDKFVETVLLPTYNQGQRRKPNPVYMALVNKARSQRIAGQRGEAKALRQQAQRLPSRDPNDPQFRRLWYVRYADDWLLGFSRPKTEAEAIKHQLAAFLQEELKLELSPDKTLITHARTEAARFLGYDIVTLHDDAKHYRAQHRRCINGVIGLKVPTEVIRAKCANYMGNGKPVHRPERTTDTDYSIVAQYQAEYRGFVQYYLMAFNVHRLWRLHDVMELSLARTLANKFKTSVPKIYRKYQTTVPTPHGTHKVLEVRRDRGPGKRPLVVRFGGIELRWQKGITLNDQPKEVYSCRWLSKPAQIR